MRSKVQKYVFERVDVRDLLPGDVVRIDSNSKVFFDGVLVKGTCLIDESLLTGESVPVSKTALARDQDKVQPNNLLYCGSKCLIVREKEVLALVLTTNWNTFKGKIIGSLVHSKTPNSIMKGEVLDFIKWGTIGCFVFLFFVIWYDYLNDKIHFKRVMTHFVDVLDTGIQPTVIFIFQVTFVVVGSKLADRGIHLLDGDKLFEAGRVKTVCFDKTGTLTESNMKLFGVVINDSVAADFDYQNRQDRVSASTIRSSVTQQNSSSQKSDQMRRKFKNMHNLFFHRNEIRLKSNRQNEAALGGPAKPASERGPTKLDDNYYSFMVMGCCHDLHYIDGEILGDPIETEMFKFTAFEIQDEAGGSDLSETEPRSGMATPQREVLNPSTRMLFSTKNVRAAMLRNRKLSLEQMIDSVYKNLPKIVPSEAFQEAYSLEEDFCFRLIKISPFNSDKKRMSVLVFAKGEFLIVTKGAAETLIPLSKRSTVPADTEGLLMDFGQQGMKILGMAYKRVDIDKYLAQLEQKYPLQFQQLHEILEEKTLGERPSAWDVLNCLDNNLLLMLLNSVDFDAEERDMHFLGHIVLKNPLKKRARRTIEELQFNFIDCKIVTGDNLFTTLNVARLSGIIHKRKSVWVAKYNKAYQRVEWLYFNFSQRSLSEVNHSFDMASQGVRGSLSHFAGISNITPGDPVRVHASHVTASVLLPESELHPDLTREAGSDKLDLLSRADEIVQSFQVHKKNVSLQRLMLLDRKERVCLALDGKSMDHLLSKCGADHAKLDFLFTRATIFARTSPDQKRLIVEQLKTIRTRDKHTVAFVGDGSNDCKALNKANVGLALGNNEASVSSSLVTSSEDIGKIIDVICLGKFSLNNMFEVFVMNNGLSFVEMTCYFFLIYNEYYFMNWKYVIETLVFTQFAFFLTFGLSNRSINRFYPTAGILNWQTMTFLLGQLAITFALVACGFFLYRSQLFYKDYDHIFGHEPFTDLELHFTTDSMLLSFLFTFISVGYVLGLYTGFPYKRSVFREVFFLLYIAALVFLNFVAIRPALFTDSYAVQEFFIYYSRTPDIEDRFFARWLGFGVLAGFLVFFSGRALRYFTFAEELVGIKRQMSARRKEQRQLGHGDLARDDSPEHKADPLSDSDSHSN